MPVSENQTKTGSLIIILVFCTIAVIAGWIFRTIELKSKEDSAYEQNVSKTAFLAHYYETIALKGSMQSALKMIKCIDDKKANIDSFSETQECRKHIQTSSDVPAKNNKHPSVFSSDYRFLLAINDCFDVHYTLNRQHCQDLPDGVIKNLKVYRRYDNKNIEAIKDELARKIKDSFDIHLIQKGVSVLDRKYPGD